jgi:hypothetical protein
MEVIPESRCASDRLAPVEYKRSGCMLTPLLIGYD